RMTNVKQEPTERPDTRDARSGSQRCGLERSRDHTLASQSASESPPAESLETEARGAQCRRSVTRVVSVRLLPVFLPRTGHVGGAQRHWFAFRAGMAQTAGEVPAVDCLAAERAV